jgi:tRNA G18 (ribose-2'-O)-methylase SpoU
MSADLDLIRRAASRGYFGIGIVNGKTEKNIGTLWRTATLYGAGYIFTVGARYKKQASDTPNTPMHTPLFEFADFDDLLAHLPYGCPLVGVELDPRARPLREFTHPERGCYLLGAEDHGLTTAVLDRCHHLIQIPTPFTASMNVATAGALVMDHRYNSRIEVAV